MDGEDEVKENLCAEQVDDGLEHFLISSHRNYYDGALHSKDEEDFS